MRNIVFHKETKTFHLYNEKISYIMCVLENGHMGQIYFGKKIHDKEDFSYLVEKIDRPMTSYIYEWDKSFSLEHIRQEYPVYGTTDYRHPAIELLQKNGSVSHSKIALATSSSLNAHKSSMEPPPRPTMITSTPSASNARIPFTILLTAPSPCTSAGYKISCT